MRVLRCFFLCFSWFSLSLLALEGSADLKLNHLQLKGTHNSYHQASSLLGWTRLGYTHAPLKEQFQNQGVRQIELDVHQCRGGDFCVYHIDVIDTGTSCDTLRDCLFEVKEWSDANKSHHPLFIFLELKDAPSASRDPSFFTSLEGAILGVFKRNELLVPDDVRQNMFTLKQAVQKKGWPDINSVRGKMVFVLLDEGGHRDNYTFDAPALQKRLMFTTSSPAREDAAIFKLDHPLVSKEKIEKLVKAGFIVRTRADEDLMEPSASDFSRLHTALETGAHIISTDVPMRLPDYNYWFDLKEGMPSRCNPVTAPLSCRAQDL